MKPRALHVGMVCCCWLAAYATTCGAEPANSGVAEPARSTDAALAKIAEPAEVPGLPRVLLIGDSISGGYTVPVRELLAGKANVVRVGYNGGPTTKGLAFLKKSLGDRKWDVIHFNWGLHDLAFVDENNNRVADTTLPGVRRQVPIDEYERNLRELVRQLQGTDAALIWCSTTPIPPGAKGRIPGDELVYNRVAEKVMREAGITIDDLYAHAVVRQQEIQHRGDVHFTDAGSCYLAEKVAAVIATALPSNGGPSR